MNADTVWIENANFLLHISSVVLDCFPPTHTTWLTTSFGIHWNRVSTSISLTLGLRPGPSWGFSLDEWENCRHLPHGSGTEVTQVNMSVSLGVRRRRKKCQRSQIELLHQEKHGELEEQSEHIKWLFALKGKKNWALECVRNLLRRHLI